MRILQVLAFTEYIGCNQHPQFIVCRDIRLIAYWREALYYGRRILAAARCLIYMLYASLLQLVIYVVGGI